MVLAKSFDDHAALLRARDHATVDHAMRGGGAERRAEHEEQMTRHPHCAATASRVRGLCARDADAVMRLSTPAKDGKIPRACVRLFTCWYSRASLLGSLGVPQQSLDGRWSYGTHQMYHTNRGNLLSAASHSPAIH